MFDNDIINFEEINPKQFTGSNLDDWFYLNDYINRRLFINSEISQMSVFEIIHHITQYNIDDKDIPVNERKPIIIQITTDGGDIIAGFELIDAIATSKTPVYTVAIGGVYSMGVWIYLAGHKRYAYENSTYLIHDGSWMIGDSTSKARDTMKFSERINDRIKDYALERTAITEDVYNEHSREEWYMFSDEAKSYGIVQHIIGQDCELNEIM